MSERIILSEKLEDNKAAVEWGKKQADLIKKGEEITQRLIKNTHLLFCHAMYRKQKAVIDLFLYNTISSGSIV